MKNDTKEYLTFVIICITICALILGIDLSIPLGVAGGVPYILVVLIALRTKNTKFIYYISILCSFLTIIGYFYSPQGGEHWQVVINRFLALFAIWVTALLSIKVLHETQKEIKTLRGFIPICSSCKKIRDDEGFWIQIESYIHAHSEAQFSHGICPDCMKKLYPEYVNKVDEKITKNT